MPTDNWPAIGDHNGPNSVPRVPFFIAIQRRGRHREPNHALISGYKAGWRDCSAYEGSSSPVIVVYTAM
jgi:hypothetical protein